MFSYILASRLVFYVGRGFSLITSLIVLIVLLEEMTRFYVRLARLNGALQRERSAKLISLEVMTASIAHEINQPISALVTNGGNRIAVAGQG